MGRRKVVDVQKPDVVQICQGEEHGYFLTSDGDVYSWGSNTHGQLGRSPPSPEDELRPVVIAELRIFGDVVQIGSGRAHGIALTTGGSVCTWGCNRSGQLGLVGTEDCPTSAGREPRKVQLPDDQQAKSVCAGAQSSACVTVNGNIYVWGEYAAFQGVSSPGEPRPLFPLSDRWIGDFVPGQIAIYRESIAATTELRNPEDELNRRAETLKARNMYWRSKVRTMASQGLLDDECLSPSNRRALTIEKHHGEKRDDSAEDFYQLASFSKDLEKELKEARKAVEEATRILETIVESARKLEYDLLRF